MIANTITIDKPQPDDYKSWRVLWDQYTRFYGYDNFSDEITQTTWHRFFDVTEPVYALVARLNGEIVGIVHYLLHRNTWQIELDCYLQDLYVVESSRGHSVARLLVEAVYKEAQTMHVKTVYWQTHQDNHLARKLYDKLAEHLGFIVYNKNLA